MEFIFCLTKISGNYIIILKVEVYFKLIKTQKRNLKMKYSIQTISKVLGIPPSTLRYYDKEGLLPFVEKTSAGVRQFKDADIEWLLTIECLKQCGMKISDIAKYVSLCEKGNSTINERYLMLQNLERNINEQIKFLKNSKKRIDFKLWFYQKLVETDGNFMAETNESYSFRNDAVDYIEKLHKIAENKNKAE